MSEYDWDDDDFDAEDVQQKESNALREARKAYKMMKQQNKELAERVAAFEKSQRENAVKSVLTTKGLNPKIAAFIPEGITSTEDVEAWVSEYAEVFGGTSSQPQGGSDAAPSPELQALSRIGQVQQTGVPFTGDADQMASLIKGASSQEELNKILFGNATGPTAI